MERRVKHHPKSEVAELFGWIGAILVLSSYALLSLDIVSGDSILYHSLVLIGSSALAIITYRHKAFQSLIVNVAFSFFAFLALIRLIAFA